MPLASLPPDLRAWTRTLVRQYGVRAGQRLGQHFLVDRRVLADIVRSAAPCAAVPVLEVGGGFGVLTLALLDGGARVTVVELDRHLAPALRKLAAIAPQLTVLEGDILKVPDRALQQALGSREFDVVANLPYEISGAFLRRFLGGSLRARAMTLLVQREVGARLTAAPGEMSLLSLLAALACAKREVVRLVPPQAFWPPPRVTSCLVRLELNAEVARERALGGVPEAQVWRLARIGFAARRKLLKNNLASALPLPAEALARALALAGIAPQARAQELSLEQWVALTRTLGDHLVQ